MRILVTGASRGLGLAIAHYLTHQCEPGQYQVDAISRTPPPSCSEWGLSEDVAQWYQIDLSGTQTIEQTLETIDWASYDGLVLNAGQGLGKLLPATSMAEVATNLHVNLYANIRLATLYLRCRLKTQQPGVIVIVSSIAALGGFSGLSVYGAAKAGLVGFMRGLAREWGSKGWRVNAVCPGFLETEMTEMLPHTEKEKIRRRTPLQRLGQSMDVAPVVEFLLSEKAQWITGQALVVDGGMSL